MGYNLYIIDPDGSINTIEWTKKDKPTFEDMYPLIGCDTIQISTVYLPEFSNRKDGYVQIHIDEEGLFKDPVPQVNRRITSAWYKWQEKTGHMCIPGDQIRGKVAIIQKTDAAERKAAPVKQ